jgi:hypothetical protein
MVTVPLYLLSLNVCLIECNASSEFTDKSFMLFCTFIYFLSLSCIFPHSSYLSILSSFLSPSFPAAPLHPNCSRKYLWSYDGWRHLLHINKGSTIERYKIPYMSQFELFSHPNNGAAIKCSTLFTFLIICPRLTALKSSDIILFTPRWLKGPLYILHER